jgi:hypothetical protein
MPMSSASNWFLTTGIAMVRRPIYVLYNLSRLRIARRLGFSGRRTGTTSDRKYKVKTWMGTFPVEDYAPQDTDAEIRRVAVSKRNAMPSRYRGNQRGILFTSVFVMAWLSVRPPPGRRPLPLRGGTPTQVLPPVEVVPSQCDGAYYG